MPHFFETVSKYNRKIVERYKIDTPNTQIQDCYISWLGTDNGKCGIMAQTSHLCELMRLCKCFEHVSKIPTLKYLVV